MKTYQILIVDFGSQYTIVIARTLAELGFQSIIVEPGQVSNYLEENIQPKAIILSGGNASVYDQDAPTIPSTVLSGNYYVLGLCYGMQLMSYMENHSNVTRGNDSQKGYGPVTVTQITESANPLFKGLPEKITVWASHGDIVSTVPAGYKLLAYSELNGSKVFEAIQDTKTEKIFGVQFHPEVIETEDDNMILKNFTELAGCEKDWDPKDVINKIQEETLAEIGDGKAFIGVSGGVDSTTLAAMLAPKLGERMYACIIDHGGMRQNEVKEVEIVAKKAGIDLHVVDAAAFFHETIGDATDPEEKRKRFQTAYAKTFETVIKEQGITHMIQGTLATDLIESGKAGKSAHIKSHHNVGLSFSVPQIEPLKALFKYEVRDIARLLGLDKEISERKPFPGPGLYLRVLGVPATAELIEIVRDADAKITAILKAENMFSEISQLVVALNGIKTVGIKGDARSFEYSIVVRPVKTHDFMTVRPFYLPESVMEKITNEVTKVSSINRVFWDYTSKPPATTEFQ